MKGFDMYYLFLITIFSFSLIASEELAPIDVVEIHSTQDLLDFIPVNNSVKGEELRKRRETSVGEILRSKPGVNSSSFGPSSSRPIVRGQEGDRVKILQNGLNVLDASSESLDHAVPVDTLSIDQIDLVRGPMSLLYGPSVIGGIVNISSKRIRSDLETGTFSRALIFGESVNSGLNSFFQLDHGVSRWMLHVDGSTRNLSDQKIPAHLKGGASQEKGSLPNSFNQQDNLGFGATHILNQGFFGLAFNHFNSNYGSVADEEVLIDMTQNRGEFHFEFNFEEDHYFDHMKVKSVQSDYSHKEIEDGQTGTIFSNKGNDSRLEFIHHGGKHQNVIGLQSSMNSFKAQGEEAFLPTTDNLKLAGFFLTDYKMARDQKMIFAFRTEAIQIDKNKSSKFGDSEEKNYSTFNASIGHVLNLNRKNSLQSNASYTERAPNAQELFALGDHLATASFEEGNEALKKEKAYSFELTFERKLNEGKFALSTYGQMFKDYIFLGATGETSNSPEGLTEYLYQRTDALFYGAELETMWNLGEWRKGVYSIFATADYVRAKDTDSGYNLPRISPGRTSFGLEYQKEKWKTDLELQYYFHQTKTALNENWTGAYEQVNLGYQYNVQKENYSLNFFTRVRNIFDAEVRNHVSMLKAIAPMPGRNVVLGIETNF